MLETILTLFGSPVLGGLLGSVTSYFTRKEERRFRQMELDHELRIEDTRSRNRIEEAEISGKLKVEDQEVKAFRESQKSSDLGQTIRACVRPLLLAYLCVIVTYIALQINTVLGGLEVLPFEELVSIYKELIATVLFMFTTSGTWYFGTRNSQATRNPR